VAVLYILEPNFSEGHTWGGGAAHRSPQVLSLLALLVQKYKYYKYVGGGRGAPQPAGTQFTCFTSTAVQILARGAAEPAGKA
jgi:hypothetical protein